ncbi:MAG: aldehyde dehydrogenase family protein, partial [Candidatus Eremiobacteraeota bacterium]|nr:aldehyde dehydrogenase family protein [Candidatus Eremiobacteraeota bacterium]
MSTLAEATKAQLLIGNAWRDAADGRTYEDRNPATDKKIADVADASRDDLNAAVSAARRAFDSGKWPTMAASRRAKIIYKMAQLIAERSAEIAALEVRDNGKAIATAKGELGA